MCTPSRMSETSGFNKAMEGEDPFSSQLKSYCDESNMMSARKKTLQVQLVSINDQINAFQTITSGTEYHNNFSDQLIDNIRKIIGSEMTEVISESRKRKPTASHTEIKYDQIPAKRNKMITTSLSSAKKVTRVHPVVTNVAEIVGSRNRKSLLPETPINPKGIKPQPRLIYQPPILTNPNLWKIKLERDYNGIHQDMSESVSPASPAFSKTPKVELPGSVASSSSSWKQKKVPMPEIIPESWNFKTIRNNIYVGAKPNLNPNNVGQICSCPDTERDKCVENCLNRMVAIECPKSCGDLCRNRRIQQHENSGNLKRFMTPNKGWGVRTNKPIKEGDFIFEYVGEVITREFFEERVETIYAKDVHHYCLRVEKGMVIDAYRVGSQCRFVNHSCDPNCQMIKWYVNGLPRMGLFARSDIERGEELSYYYGSVLFNPNEDQVCYCGSSKCQGIVGGLSVTTGKRIEAAITKKSIKST